MDELQGKTHELSSVLHEKCRFFIRRGKENPTEVENLSMLQTDDDIFLSLSYWSGGYDTEIVSDSESDESWDGWLIKGKEIVLETAWILLASMFFMLQHTNKKCPCLICCTVERKK